MKYAPLPGIVRNISTQGYKKDSPDVENVSNTIPSGDITMKNVEFPIIGIDNLGNKELMKPGKNYKFPGTSVSEIPLK